MYHFGLAQQFFENTQNMKNNIINKYIFYKVPYTITITERDPLYFYLLYSMQNRILNKLQKTIKKKL